MYPLSQAPGWSAQEHAGQFGRELAGALGEAGFKPEEVLSNGHGSGFAAAVIARASR
jgi:protein-L-isoaspartate O-methyltransferase